MTSFSLKTEKRRGVFVKLVRDTQHVLNVALAEENESRGLTRAAISKELEKNKSAISRAFQETGNLTLETIADLAFALKRIPEISLVKADDRQGANYSLYETENILKRPESNRLEALSEATHIHEHSGEFRTLNNLRPKAPSSFGQMKDLSSLVAINSLPNRARISDK